MLISGALDILVSALAGMPRKMRQEGVQDHLLVHESQICCPHQVLDKILPEEQEVDHQVAPC